MEDIVGMTFSHLTVLAHIGVEKDHRHFYACLCSCGNIKRIGRSNLRSGGTKSCGCKTNEMLVEKRTTHGGCGTNTYSTWEGMVARCYNKNHQSYHNYGGRGISVCDRWLCFENFLFDMGEKPDGAQLDRKDNNGNYCKENCRWVDAKTNARNTRRSVLIEWNGVAKTVAEWSEITGILDETIRYRFHKKWPIDLIFSKTHGGRGNGTSLKVGKEPD